MTTALHVVKDALSMLAVLYLVVVGGQNLYGMWSVMFQGLVVPNRNVRIFFAVAILAFVVASAVSVRAMWWTTAWGRP